MNKNRLISLSSVLLALMNASCEKKVDSPFVGEDGKSISYKGQLVFQSEDKILKAEEIVLNKSSRKVLSWTSETEDGEESYFAIDSKGNGKFQVKKAKGIASKVMHQDKSLAKDYGPLAKGLFIVSFKTQFLPEYQEKLSSLGVELLKYFPHQSYISYLDRAALKQIEALAFVKSVKAMPLELKLPSQLLSDKPGLGRYNVLLFDKISKEGLKKDLNRLGLSKVKVDSKSIMIEDIELEWDQVVGLIRLAEVAYLEKSTAPETDMNLVRIQGGANFMETKTVFPEANYPRFTGVGVRGHVLEGIDPSHQDFKANEHRQLPIGVDGTMVTRHGQATYSIVFGAGEGDSKARGMIPNAQGLYTDYNTVHGSDAHSKNRGARYELVGRLIDEHDVMFQTASWGYGRNTEYDTRSAEMDRIILHHDIPITQSQSNSGTTMSRPQAWAKNIISVGAVYHYGSTNPEDHKWNYGASIGPAPDGRIKPDLVAYYDDTLAAEVGAGYWEFGGTSGATPIVAGHVGMFVEMWTDGLFNVTPRFPGNMRFANRPGATITKAILINSARQYEFEGPNHDLTRVHQGWGFPSLEDLYQNREDMLIVNETEVLKSLETKSYEYEVVDGAGELKVTLVYNDPEANLSATLQRINNLDLKVTSPSGTVSYWGNNGLLENNFSVAGGEANEIDTVENVFIQNPEAGKWTIEVIAAEVNEDAHLETSDVDIDFSLVVSTYKKDQESGSFETFFGLAIGEEEAVKGKTSDWQAVETAERGFAFESTSNPSQVSEGVLTLKPIDMVQGAVLEFQVSAVLDQFKGRGHVEIKPQGSDEWISIYRVVGSYEWRSERIDLSSYVEAGTNLEMRFRSEFQAHDESMSWKISQIQFLKKGETVVTQGDVRSDAG